MAKRHFNHTAQIAQTITQNVKQNIEFILPDGIHFDSTIGEHVIVVGGEIVNYAFHWSTAAAQFKEASRVRREHLRKCQPAEV